jgi:DNA primase
MGKTYLETIKYLIVADFQVDGLVEKPDVIGAIFGQSEGLLGSQLDIKELQQNGKIGRIEITTSHNNNKTYGTLKLPCSLSMVETVIIAASIESIDKVGPCDTRFTIKKVEDTRGLKRKQIKDRAIDLLGKIMQEEIPDTRELMEEIVNTFKTKEIVLYGPDKLPAGPTIDSNKEIIIVEGRADVINMLKYGFTNVISTGGARIPSSLPDICKNKTVTLFLDGDRGADIQQSQLLRALKVDFIARAPDGKEVEELTQKEINQAMRRKVKSNFVIDLVKEKNGNLEKIQNNNHQNKSSPNIVKQTKFSTTNDHKVINTFKPFLKKENDFSKDKNDFSSMLSNIPNVERIDVSEDRFDRNNRSNRSSYDRNKPNSYDRNKPHSYDRNKPNNYDKNNKPSSYNKGTYNQNNAFEKKQDDLKGQKFSLKDRLESALKEFDNKSTNTNIVQDVKESLEKNIKKEDVKTKPIIKDEKKEVLENKESLEKEKKKASPFKMTDKIRKNLLKILEEIDGKGQSRILNEKLRRIGSSKSSELLSKIKSFKTGKIYAVITDLEINPEILSVCKEKDVVVLVSPKSKIKDDSEIKILTYNELKK